MSANEDTTATERVTLEQIKHRAEEIKDLAAVEAKDAAARVMGEESVKTLVLVVGVVVVAASVAYYLGARSRRVFVDAG